MDNVLTSEANVLTREAILGFKNVPRVFHSAMLGGDIVYRNATVRDRMRSRILGMEAGELKAERIEAALILTCCIEPKFSELDMEMLMDLPSVETQKLANLILYGVEKLGNPT